VVELTKPFGRDIELGLEKGKYRIIDIRGDRVYEAEIHLREGERFELYQDQFTKTDKIYTKARGDVFAHVQSKKQAYLKGRRGINLVLVGAFKFQQFSGEEHAGSLTFRIGYSLKIPLYLDYFNYKKTESNRKHWGFNLGYSFAPWRKHHLRAGAELSILKENNKTYGIFEPKIFLMTNLGRFTRLGFGIGYPFVHRDASIKRRVSLTLGFEWGR
jgi:hypothetical protein